MLLLLLYYLLVLTLFRCLIIENYPSWDYFYWKFPLKTCWKFEAGELSFDSSKILEANLPSFTLIDLYDLGALKLSGKELTIGKVKTSYYY
jgi:hypothetical protein